MTVLILTPELQSAIVASYTALPEMAGPMGPETSMS